jgi:hypothetical protein
MCVPARPPARHHGPNHFTKNQKEHDMTTRFSHHALTGALCAALLAGCSAGSQFAPPTGSAGSQPAAFQPVAPMHAPKSGRGDGVSPAWLMWTGAVLINGKLHYYWINPRTYQWTWLPTTTKGSGGSTLGGSLAHANELNMATTGSAVVVYSGQKLVNTLTGVNGAATGVETDSRGNTFVAANTTGAAAVEEFAAGGNTLTATYVDHYLQSVASLGIDKANHVYVEGTSVTGGIEVDEMFGSSFKALAVPGSPTMGATPGGLAVQSSGKTTYLWINDLGNASDPANITRYAFTGKSLVKQSSFQYAGINGAIAVDPKGKDTSHVYAVNNVAAGSQYSVSGIEYTYPSGQIASQSSAQTASQESVGISVK